MALRATSLFVFCLFFSCFLVFFFSPVLFSGFLLLSCFVFCVWFLVLVAACALNCFSGLHWLLLLSCVLWVLPRLVSWKDVEDGCGSGSQDDSGSCEEDF